MMPSAALSDGHTERDLTLEKLPAAEAGDGCNHKSAHNLCSTIALDAHSFLQG